MKTSLAPIALFVYNRPGFTEKCLQSLKRNYLSEQSELFIFADGSKENCSGEDLKNIELVRETCLSERWCNKVHFIASEKNKGLSNAIIEGITKIVNEYDKVIVLEDDLILSPGFLKYINEGLDMYQNNAEVMNVSGYIYPVHVKLPENFFQIGTSIWGWGTWKRAWQKFNSSSQFLIEEIKNRNAIRKFNMNNAYNYYQMLLDQNDGKINSWGIRWYGSVFVNNGYVLLPGRSLVNNIGHDNSGTHCTTTQIYYHNELADKINVESIPVQEYTEYLEGIISLFQPNKPSMLNSFTQKLKNLDFFN